MKNPVFCTAGSSSALRHAANQLVHWGYEVAHFPSREVTHLLLPVPSFEADGKLKGGAQLEAVLAQLPADTVVLGGNLPALPFPCIDFLKDEYYLQENAAITARCTLSLIQQKQKTIPGAKALVIGWDGSASSLRHCYNRRERKLRSLPGRNRIGWKQSHRDMKQ